ncbi:MAG: ABC transporter ATP-binding protein [Pseudobutyrivibrio sp.]|nr:ABC transporter ATP-binding protein [Pseudobutyrivibrio sp.]
MALISANNLTIGYDGHPVLSNLNFEINAGDYFCIVGENGSGKTTLMKTILGLQQPISGAIEFGEGLAKNQIGYLPQQTDVQRDFPASVYEIVLSGCQNALGKKFFYSKEQKALALSNIKKMGIEHLKDRCYRELSGGQQQRVLLARALCATQRALLLDEPVAGLDPNVTAEMYELIKQLNDDGLTIIMISHDIQNVQGYANRIYDVAEEV